MEGKHREEEMGFIQGSRREGKNEAQSQGLGRGGVESLQKFSFDHFYLLSEVGREVNS